MTNPIIVFTDGASKGNPGPGGWGAVICDGTTVTELGGADPSTTNNRMEMLAAISALERIQSSEQDIAIYTDSTYLIQGITKWIQGWRRRGWKTSTGGDVLNRDLWENLESLVGKVGGKIAWSYVPGHAGIPGNERVDTIASELALGNHVDLYQGAASAYDVDLTPPSSADPPARRKSSGKRKSGKAYSYLSVVDGVAVRHATWAECERRVRGTSGAKYKKAMSADEQADILRDWGVSLD